MTNKSVPQECPTREFRKSVPRECPTRVSHKSDIQECPTREFRKSVPRECPTRVTYKSVPQECPRSASHKSVPQECPARVFYESVLQECPTRVSVIQGVPQECTRVSHKAFRKESVLRVSHKSVSYKSVKNCSGVFSSTCLHSGSWAPSGFLPSPLSVPPLSGRSSTERSSRRIKGAGRGPCAMRSPKGSTNRASNHRGTPRRRRRTNRWSARNRPVVVVRRIGS